MTVSLVIVSHSEKLAAGVVELAGQMAPDVRIVAAGGTDRDISGQGALGTSLAKISAAFAAAEAGDGILVLADLGSALMTVEAAFELFGNSEGIQLAEAPLVEGAVAAAVVAQSGAALLAVKAAAEAAAGGGGAAPGSVAFTAIRSDHAPVNPGPKPRLSPSFTSSSTPRGAETVLADNEGTLRTAVRLINPTGLHARPAATLAAALSAMNVDIEINGVDGQSVMMLMTLGAAQGATLQVTASGPEAYRAIELVRSEVERGFGEI